MERIVLTMVYDKEIKGMFVTLRSITLEDVEFSYAIRSQPKNRDTVGQLAPSLEAQKEFIMWQINQPDDYYFVVHNNQGERIGLIGLYDIHDGVGEVGRVVNNGTPEESMEAELLNFKFAFETLCLKKCTYVIYSHNRKHIAQQMQLGITPSKTVTRNGTKCAYFEIFCDDEKVIHRQKKIEKLLSRVFEMKRI